MARLKGRNKRTDSMQTAFIRFMLVVAFFIFWIGAVSVRLVHLQVNEHGKWKELAANQRQDRVKKKKLRGTIYDRNGNELAISVRVNSLIADPSSIKDVRATVAAIAPVIGADPHKLEATIRDKKAKGKQFLRLLRKTDKELEDKIVKEFFLTDKGKKNPLASAFRWEQEQKREYPNKKLASQVIGFSNLDDRGVAGIERSQESFLKAEEIKKVLKRDRKGRVFDETMSESNTAKDVYLTIDRSFQFIAENALEEGVKKVNAKSGRVVILNPKSGEILAMANYPTFDPNNFRKLKRSAWRNGAIEDQYSPGSVFKLVTYGAALEEGLIGENDEVDCSLGRITVGGYEFKDSHTIGKVSYLKAFAESSNVGAIKTGQMLGKRNFYGYARDFGFGEKTGVGLPAEASGVVRTPGREGSPNKRWSGSTLASMSIGYSVDVTALQSAVAFATIANDGVRVSPMIIRDVKQDGVSVIEREVKTKRIVKVETAQKLRKMLSAVVVDGTAKKAKLESYTSGGKTGTAWKYMQSSSKIDRKRYISSFVGMAPADDPAIVVAVVIDEPKGALRYGGDVAAPVFSSVTQKILEKLGVAPDLDMEEIGTGDEEDPASIVDEPQQGVPILENQLEKKEHKKDKKDSKKTKEKARKEKPKQLPQRKPTQEKRV